MNDVSSTRPRAASQAVWHWRWQRITALLLLLLTAWFMTSLATEVIHADPKGLATWLKHPTVSLALAAMVLFGYVHMHIGLHEIVTDYIRCPIKKRVVSVLLDVATLALLLGTLAAVWTLHLGGSL